MSKSDFIFVGSPHTPITISGSDPHTTLSGIPYPGGARLSVWYKMDPGMYTTNSTDNSLSRKRVDTILDSSGNGQTIFSRALHRLDDYIPVLESDQGADPTNQTLKGDPDDEAQGSLFMRNGSLGASDAPANTAATSYSTWIVGPSTNDQAKDQTSIFTCIRYITDGGSISYPLTVTYGSDVRGSVGNDGKHGTFSFGLCHDNSPAAHAGGFTDSATESRTLWTGFSHINAVDGSTETSLGGYHRDLDSGYHALSLVYEGTASAKAPSILRTYADGRLDTEKDFTEGIAAAYPGHHGAQKQVMIGGTTYDKGGGYADGNSATSSIGEFFAFDDALSDIRRQQMEKYMCDKYGVTMKSSEYLSEFQGGAEGVPLPHHLPHASIVTTTDPVTSSISTFGRKYVQKKDSSIGDGRIHYETVAGAFVKSSTSSGLFYEPVNGSASISSQAWVRIDNTGSIPSLGGNYGGSQIALVARATEPFGHQLDNLKGYALKLGTFKDGAFTDSLKMRLSTRNAKQYLDGKTDDSCGDEDLSYNVTTGSWYQMRLDVKRRGAMQDAHTAYNTTAFTTKTADFSRTQHDASGTIGPKTDWENLIGTNAKTPGEEYYAYSTGNAAQNLLISSGSYWSDNIFNSNDGDLTISFWVYKAGDFAGSYPRLVCWGGYGYNEHEIYYSTSNDRFTWFTNYGGTRYDATWDNTRLSPWTWNHVVLTVKVASDAGNIVDPTLYLNGVNYGQESLDASGTRRLSTDNKLRIFGSQKNEDYAGNIAIRDIGIWNHQCSAQESAQLYNSGSITNGYDTLASRQSLCRAYYELTGAVSAPYIGEFGNNTAYMDIGSANTYWNSNLASNSGEVTYMGWFKTNSNQSSQHNSLLGAGKWDTGGTGDGWRISYDQNDEEIDFTINYGGNSIVYKSTATDIPENQWNHIAVTFKTGTNYGNGAGDTAPKIYINGTLDANSSNISSGYSAPSDSTAFTVTDTSTNLYIGKDRDSADFDNAYFREVGIWNKILTGTEVTTAYSNGQFANNSTIQNGSCKGYWSFETPTTNSGYLRLDGNEYVMAQDGSGYLYYPERELDSGATRGKVSFSSWIYSEWSTRSKQIIMQLGSSSEYFVNVDSGKVQLEVDYSSTSNITYSWPSMSALTDNAFSHIVIVWDAGKTAEDRVVPILYVNGSSQGSATESSAPGNSETWKDHSGHIHLGTRYGWGDTFDGRLKHMAVWNKLLTQSNVNALYNSGNGVDASTIEMRYLAWYWTMQNKDSAAKLTGYNLKTWAGDSHITDVSYPDSMSQNEASSTKVIHKEDISPGTMYIDSSNSLLPSELSRTTPTISALDPLGESWTLMGWYKPANFTDHAVMVEFGQRSNNEMGNVLYVRTNGTLGYALEEPNTDQDYCHSTTALTADEWNHIAAVVYPYTTTKNVQFYINGVYAGLSNPDWSTKYRSSWNGVEKIQNYSSSKTAARFGIGHGDNPTRESRGPISDFAVYQGALNFQEISGAYNDGNLHTAGEEKHAYDFNRLVTGSSTSWNQVGHWKMGDTSYASTGKRYHIIGDPPSSPAIGGFKDLSIGSAHAMLTSSTVAASTDTTNVQVPYQVLARSDGYDTVKAYARKDSDEVWELLTEKVISHSGSNAYRYVKGENPPSSKMPAHNARYNGYYVSLSSSDGYRNEAEHYIENYEIETSGSRLSNSTSN